MPIRKRPEYFLVRSLRTDKPKRPFAATSLGHSLESIRAAFPKPSSGHAFRAARRDHLQRDRFGPVDYYIIGKFRDSPETHRPRRDVLPPASHQLAFC